MKKFGQKILMCIFMSGIFMGAVYAAEETESVMNACFECHGLELTTFAITPHSKEGDCSICHGEAAAHLAEEEKKDNILNPRYLGRKKSNRICLDCHQEKERGVHETFQAEANLHDDLLCIDCHQMHSRVSDTQSQLDSSREDLTVDCALCHRENAELLEDSVHGLSGMHCADCHKLHEQKTISRDIEEQIDRCLFCHPAQELEFKYPYTHPLRERQIKCSDCHNPHSSRNHAMLKQRGDKVCVECHRDIKIEGGKHPVSKGTDHPFQRVKCLDCHRPHGAGFSGVLKHDSESLCQTCHD